MSSVQRKARQLQQQLNIPYTRALAIAKGTIPMPVGAGGGQGSGFPRTQASGSSAASSGWPPRPETVVAETVVGTVELWRGDAVPAILAEAITKWLPTDPYIDVIATDVLFDQNGAECDFVDDFDGSEMWSARLEVVLTVSCYVSLADSNALQQSRGATVEWADGADEQIQVANVTVEVEFDVRVSGDYVENSELLAASVVEGVDVLAFRG